MVDAELEFAVLYRDSETPRNCGDLGTVLRRAAPEHGDRILRRPSPTVVPAGEWELVDPAIAVDHPLHQFAIRYDDGYIRPLPLDVALTKMSAAHGDELVRRTREHVHAEEWIDVTAEYTAAGGVPPGPDGPSMGDPSRRGRQR